MKKKAFLTTLFVTVALFLPLAGCSHSSSSGGDSGSSGGRISYNDAIIGAWISLDEVVTLTFDNEGNYTYKDSSIKTGTYEKDYGSGNYVLKKDGGSFVFEINEDGTSATLYETDENGTKKTEFTIDISCCTVPQAAKYIKTLTENQTYTIIVKDDFTTSCSSLKSALINLSAEKTGPYVSLDLTDATALDLSGAAFGNYSTTSEEKYYALIEVILPSTCTSIGTYAFRCHAGLQKVVLPETLETIGSYAFCYCESLSILTSDDSNKLPSSLKTMGSCAFEYCYSLEKIDLSETQLKEILQDTFKMNAYYSSALTTVTLPKTIESIGLSAFVNCSSITTINIEKEEGKSWGHNPTYSSTASGSQVENPSKSTLTMIPCFEENAAYFLAAPTGVTLNCRENCCKNDTCCSEEKSTCVCAELTNSGYVKNYGYSYWWYKVSDTE